MMRTGVVVQQPLQPDQRLEEEVRERLEPVTVVDDEEAHELVGRLADRIADSAVEEQPLLEVVGDPVEE